MNKLPDFTPLKPYLFLILSVAVFILFFIILFKIDKAQQRKAKKETDNIDRRFYIVRSKKISRFAKVFFGYLFCLIGIAAPAVGFMIYPDIVKILLVGETAFVIIGIILIRISRCCIEVINDRAFVYPVLGSAKEYTLSELCSFSTIPTHSSEAIIINPGGIKKIFIDSTMPGYDYLKADLIAIKAGRKLKGADRIPENYSKKFKYNSKRNKKNTFKSILIFAVLSLIIWVIAFNINGKRFVKLNGEYLSIKETTKLTSEHLYKNGKPVADPDVLKKLYMVDTVDISNSNITDISILTYLPNLKSVCAENNSIADISPIADVKHLSTLNIQYNSINDISPLVNCKELNGLELCGNAIEDFSPLFEINSLKYIDLRDTAITQDEYYNLKVTYLGCIILIDF